METSEERQETSPSRQGIKDRWRQAVIFLIGVAVVVLYIGGYLRIPDPLEGTSAKGFRLASLDGKEVDLADHLGKDVILLDFWAVWCPPCRASIPELPRLSEAFGGRGLVIYAVNQQDSTTAVQNFLKGVSVSVPVLMDTEGVAGNLYGVTGIPKIVLIDRSGTVVFVQAGYGPGSEWAIRRAIEKALR